MKVLTASQLIVSILNESTNKGNVVIKAEKVNKFSATLTSKQIVHELDFDDFYELSEIFPKNIKLTDSQIDITVSDTLSRSIKLLDQFCLNKFDSKEIFQLWEKLKEY